MTAITVALVNDYEVVVRGLANMLRNYAAEVSIVELDANKRVGDRVDVALYDTFAATCNVRDRPHFLGDRGLVPRRPVLDVPTNGLIHLLR